MSSPWPTEGNTYVPQFAQLPPAPTIEDVRARGVVVCRSADGSVGTVEIQNGLVVSFCAVTLNPDGTIDDFVPRPANRYCTAKPYTGPQGSYNPPPPPNPPIAVEPPRE